MFVACSLKLTCIQHAAVDYASMAVLTDAATLQWLSRLILFQGTRLARQTVAQRLVYTKLLHLTLIYK